MILKYTDDEGDLCTITTQPEMDFAVSMNPSLLRLQIFVTGQFVATPAPTPFACHPASPQMHQRWAEHLEQKTARLAAKQTRLAAKLAETTDEERKRVLSMKLQRVQQRQAWIESRKQRSSQPDHQEKPWRANKMERGCWGRKGHKFPQHEENPSFHQFPTCPKDPQERQQRWAGCMEKRAEALGQKTVAIKAKLADEAITPERKAFLTAKLQRIQEKQVNIENKKQFFAQHCQQRHERRQQGCAQERPCHGRRGRFSGCPKNLETQ